MSWDSYIDNLVAQSKDASGHAHCDSACIISIDGGAKWTTDAAPQALKVTPGEAAAVAACFKSKNFTNLMSSGIHLVGVKYQFLREEDGKLVLGKKKGNGAISMQCSKTAIVLGHCAEGDQQGNLNKAVGVIADYLETMNM